MVDWQGERKWWTGRERGSGRLSGRQEVVVCQGERKCWTVRERGSGVLSEIEEVVGTVRERGIVDYHGERKW